MKTVKYLVILLSISSFGFSQNNKKPIDHAVYDNWKSLTNEIISNNGEWVSYEINPQKGDGWLYLWNATKNKLDSFSRGYKAVISPSSDFFIYRIKTPETIIRKAKKEKKKKEDMPKDSLGIYFFQKDTAIKMERIKSFGVPKENPDWIAIHFEKEIKKAKTDTTSTSDTIKKTEKKADPKKKKSKEKKEPGTRLLLLNSVNLDTISFSGVLEFSMAKKGGLISFIQTNKDTIDSSQVWLFNTKSKEVKSIYHSSGICKNITSNDNGDAVAFLASSDTSEKKTFSLNLWIKNNKASSVICDSTSNSIPNKWAPSEYYNPWFSENGTKLFFGTAPRPVNLPKDTLLEDEKYSVDLWHWNDPQIQSEQLKDLEKEKKKNFSAVYNIDSKTIIQISDTIYDRTNLPFKGNGKFAISSSNTKYEKTSTWDYPVPRDYILNSLENGKKTIIATEIKHNINLSPSEKFLFWYDEKERAWYIQPTNLNEKKCITCNLNVPFYDEFDDTPNDPDSWGFAGWTNNDESILIYDRYDIWKIDPNGKTPPFTISHGRKNKVKYRYEKTDLEKNFIDKKENILFHAVNETNKDEGYCYINLKSLTNEILIEKKSNINFSVKAKNTNAYLWTESTFITYPDLKYSLENFKFPNVISHTNPQQKEYLWGNVELVKWKSFDGQDLDGLLYKPENFDPNKKYPMITYFYERNSDELYRHNSPRPSRSVINFTYYTSNGYMIFVPDVTYKTGHPGDNAYNCIISGIKELSKNSWVDTKHLGLQGQSWGGYQVAYLVTRTDSMFAAAMAGAPVSNMTSAYGGIRWESGQSRMFQYEKGQSRIGATLWDSLNLYIENSPLFGVPNIKTPILIMSNDGDGAVPWYQGIELYTALRRLSKPAWLLNYNNDEHNLSKRPNMMDLTIRMQQFFDHYLKEAPAPEWMIHGIPAIKKGIENGYKTH